MKRSGYLLMESLVAMAILASIVTSLLSSMQASSNVMATAKQQNQALLMCESKIEELKWAVANSPALFTPITPGNASSANNVPTLNPNFLANYSITSLASPLPWIPANSLFRLDVGVFIFGDPTIIATLTTILAKRG